MAKVTLYKNSILASLLSLAGYFMIAGGIMAAFNGEVVPGIVLALLGIGVSWLAAWLSSQIQFLKWLRQLKKKNIPELAKSDASLALQIYQANPTKQTLRYVRKLNPTAASYIDQQLAAKQAAKKK